MSTKDFLVLGKETNKGSALHSVKDEGAAGAYDYARLNLSGIAVDTEIFTLADDVYEVNSILTDTGSESTIAVTIAATSIVFDTAFTIPALPGDVIRMESEYMIVVDYNVNGPSANVIRGQFGSTAATHSIVNSDTFQSAAPVAAGRFAVPTDDVAAAAFVIDCANAVQFWSDGGYSKGLGGGIGVRVENGLKVDAFVGPATDEVVFAKAANGGAGGANSEGFTNGTVDAAFGGGVEEASQVYTKIVHKATAGDVSAGTVDFVAPWTVDEAFAFVADSTGVQLAWAGTVVVTNGRFVAVNNGGATDWAAGDTIILTITKA